MDVEKPVIGGQIRLLTDRARGKVRFIIKGDEIPCFLFSDLDLPTLDRLIADLKGRRDELANPQMVRLWRNENV